MDRRSAILISFSSCLVSPTLLSKLISIGAYTARKLKRYRIRAQVKVLSATEIADDWLAGWLGWVNFQSVVVPASRLPWCKLFTANKSAILPGFDSGITAKKRSAYIALIPTPGALVSLWSRCSCQTRIGCFLSRGPQKLARRTWSWVGSRSSGARRAAFLKSACAMERERRLVTPEEPH